MTKTEGVNHLQCSHKGMYHRKHELIFFTAHLIFIKLKAFQHEHGSYALSACLYGIIHGVDNKLLKPIPFRKI